MEGRPGSAARRLERLSGRRRQPIEEREVALSGERRHVESGPLEVARRGEEIDRFDFGAAEPDLKIAGLGESRGQPPVAGRTGLESTQLRAGRQNGQAEQAGCPGEAPSRIGAGSGRPRRTGLLPPPRAGAGDRAGRARAPGRRPPRVRTATGSAAKPRSPLRSTRGPAPVETRPRGGAAAASSRRVARVPRRPRASGRADRAPRGDSPPRRVLRFRQSPESGGGSPGARGAASARGAAGACPARPGARASARHPQEAPTGSSRAGPSPSGQTIRRDPRSRNGSVAAGVLRGAQRIQNRVGSGSISTQLTVALRRHLAQPERSPRTSPGRPSRNGVCRRAGRSPASSPRGYAV